MKAYQIFQCISPELGRTVFQNLREEHRDAYKGVLISLAAKRRLRPVFLQRKPVPQQIEWLYKTCQVKPVDDLAENVLQVWLLKSQKPMLVQFLDELCVDHDEDGTVEDLPDALDGEKLKRAVDVLLKQFPAENVSLYLHVFQLQRPGGWDNLAALLQSDTRIALHRPGMAEAPAPAEAAPAAVTVPEAAEPSPAAPEETPDSEAAAETAPKKKRPSRKKAAEDVSGEAEVSA